VLSEPSSKGRMADEIPIGELIDMVYFRKIDMNVIQNRLQKWRHLDGRQLGGSGRLKIGKDAQKTSGLFEIAFTATTKTVQPEKEFNERSLLVLFEAHKGAWLIFKQDVRKFGLFRKIDPKTEMLMGRCFVKDTNVDIVWHGEDRITVL